MLCPTFDRKLCNVIFLGICFMLLFSADYTISNMQKTLIVSIHYDNPDFNIDGYTSLGITYAVFAFSLWFGPSVVSVIGPKYAMTLAALGYTISILAFNLERTWVIYTGMVVVGVSAGILWTAEGNYLVLNSEAKNISRNVGIFWFLFQASSLFGNLFTFFQFQGKARIDGETRRLVVYVLGATSASSVLAFLLLRGNSTKESQQTVSTQEGPIYALKKTWAVFISKEMLILNLTFCYTGLQQAFTLGVYSPSIGFTMAFGNQAKQLVALSGIFIAIGEILGAICQITLSKVMKKFSLGRSSAIAFGFIVQVTAYAIIYVNLPKNSVFGETDEKALINSNALLAVLCSMMLGFGDSCLNTQNFSIIAVLFPSDSAQSCALYKFIKSVFVATAYFTCPYLDLHIQLSILALVAFISLISFYIVDSNMGKARDTEEWSSKEKSNTCSS